MIRPEDDSFHPGSPDPYWNESAWFGFGVPERSMTGWVYFYHRPNMNFTVGGVALWDPTGEYPWTCRHYDWGQPMPLPDGADMFDFKLPNGLAVACREPLRSFQLDYDGPGLGAELTWEALAPPQAAGRAGASDMPTGSDGWGKGHYNQPGRIRGELRLAGERIEVDSLYLRDHSWGTRRPARNPRGNFASAVGDGGRSGFCVFAASDLDWAEDPGVGVADPLSFGWYLRDGVPSRLVAATRTVVARDGRGRPLAVNLEGTDELGRTLRAEGRLRNWLWWQGYANILMFWSMADWTYDGRTVVGEEQDILPLDQARRLLRRTS
ncbi:hypothetical protein GCM10023321_05860 [Pseudonocardia eucalypti]|uniref:DUF7065 domain-containing protein n=1 Tax=Pseudonocardia eucalypti TaxID=648755 RepID=A0ABP9PH03_9PSEU|nr:hypothetical protein [Pseudonocardia eucalypti]